MDNSPTERAGQSTRLHMLFLFGTVLPGGILLWRLLRIGLSHAWLFGVEPSNPIDTRTDPTVLVTTTIITIATAGQVAFRRLGSRRHGAMPLVSLVYIGVGCVVAGYMWLGIAGALP